MTVEESMVNDFREWMRTGLVHYSNKVVNSTLDAGGIRLGADQALDIPHLCGRSLMFERVEKPALTRPLDMDYASMSDRFKFIRAWLGEHDNKITDKYDLSPAGKAQVVETYKDLSDGSNGVTLQDGLKGKLPFRLKQLLIPRDGDYVALTPLPCLPLGMHLKAGFHEREGHRIELRKKAAKKSVPESERRALNKEADAQGQVASLSNYAVGGANAQNVGGRVYEAYTRPIFNPDLPRMDQNLRKAFSIAHNGINFRLPRSLVTDYHQFLDNAAGGKPVSSITWTLRLREKEAAHLHGLFETWEKQAAAARKFINDYENELPDELPCFVGARGGRMEGWLKSNQRDHKWLQTEIAAFVKSLQKYVVGKADSGDPITLGLTSVDTPRLRAALETGSLM